MARFIVLGAGMVGVCTALALQTRGHDCVIVDRRAPGSETSYGNAGIIQAEAVEPYVLPRHPLELMRLASGLDNSVRVHWPSALKQLPSLFSYWKASSRQALDSLIPIWRRMIAASIELHSILIRQSGSEHLVRKDGYWQGHRSEAKLAAAIAAAERLHRLYGVRFRSADAKQLSQDEPSLKPGLVGAIHWIDPWRVTDPGGLVASYAQLFERRGGRVIQGDASSLTQKGRGWKVAGEEAEHVIVALGPWSPEFLKRFGYRVPMVYKRGYHQHFGGDHGLRKPMLLADHSVVLSPMTQGLRIATAAELSFRVADPAPAQLVRGEAAARTLLDFAGPLEESAWAGTRPCLPRLLPLVCGASRHDGLWFHFGHGHQGFTLAPVTAERLVRTIDGEADAILNLDAGV